MKNHDVRWADPDDIDCVEHANSPYWSHLLMTVKILLIWLEKQIQKKFRTHPGSFPVCKINDIPVAPAKQEISHIPCVVNEENWFSFPGKFTLKLVRFSRKKVPKSGLIFHLQQGGKKCLIPVQFSTYSMVAKSEQFRFNFPTG